MKLSPEQLDRQRRDARDGALHGIANEQCIGQQPTVALTLRDLTGDVLDRRPRALEVDHQAGAFGLGHPVVVQHSLDQRRRRAEVRAHHQQLEPEEAGGLHVVEQLPLLQLRSDQQIGGDEHIGDADLVAFGAGQGERAPERGDRDAVAGGRDQRDRELRAIAVQPGTRTLAVSRSIDLAREQGRLTPVIRTPSAVCVACMVGARIPPPARPSANPEANNRLLVAMPSSIIHSMPWETSLSATRLATEKWCIVVPTASDGDRDPIAR